MKITFTEILITATALVTTISVHAHIAPESQASTVEFASVKYSGSSPLIGWSPVKTRTKDSYLCQSASLGLNKNLKAPGT